MTSNLDKLKSDLESLQKLAKDLLLVLTTEIEGNDYALFIWDQDPSDDEFEEFMRKKPDFIRDYQTWYSQALTVLKQLLPDRVADFKAQYDSGTPTPGPSTYAISDYLMAVGVTKDAYDIGLQKFAVPRMQQQNAILQAATARFESSLFEIKQVVQADLFDSEIDAAKHLLKEKFLRAAGAVAGVVLEKHLRQVCDNHSIKVTKKNPTIGDLNQLLKDYGTIGIPQWRYISLLADLRNLCDHQKQTEPTNENVSDLIDGTDKVIRTIA